MTSNFQADVQFSQSIRIQLPDGFLGAGSDGLEQAEGPRGHHIRRVVRDLEGDGDMRLGGEVVDLIGEEEVNPAAEGGGVGEVGVVELHAGLVQVVGVHVQVVQAGRVEVGRPPDQPVDLVPLGQQELGQVGPVLARDAGDQGDLALLRDGCGDLGRVGGGLVVAVGCGIVVVWIGGGHFGNWAGLGWAADLRMGEGEGDGI